MQQEKGFWKKRILVPFWVVRICILLLIIIASALALRQVDSIKDIARPAIGSIVLFMIFIIIVLLIDVLNIVLFLRDALKPRPFLIASSFQTGFFCGILIIESLSIGKGASLVGLAFSFFAFLSFFGLQIYAIIGFRREKAAAQRGHYAPAHNPATDLHGTPYAGAPEHNLQSTAYHSQTHPPAAMHGTSDDYYQQPMKPAHMV